MARTSLNATVSAPAIAVALLLSAAAAGSASLEQQLRQCSAIEEPQQRLTCYDALGRQLPAASGSAVEQEVSGELDAAATRSGAEPVAAPAADTAATASTRKPPDENFGGYRYQDPEEDPDEMAMVTRVVDCEKERGSGSWYFRFENDQVWKQVDRRTLNFQGCDFPVKVLSDGFGYVMRIEGREGKIRVSRRK